MNIGFFGNTNNAPLMIAQALRHLGHEVLLVVTSQELLNRPESRYPEFKKGYPDWILDAAHLSEWDIMSLSPSLAPVLDVLSNCDGLILNASGPSLWRLLRRPAIALLTGSDLEDYANFATVEVRSRDWGPVYKEAAEGRMDLNLVQDFVQRQREGIAEAVAVRYLPRGLVPAGDAILDELGVSDSNRDFPYFAELQLIKPTPAPHNKPTRIFCATRLTWKLPVESGRSFLDYKGSDIMIRGLGLFFRQTGVRLDIQLIRKGLHVAETERLVAEEGLTDQVTWLNEMPLTDVWSEFSRCDIVIEQLADSAIGMAGMDALASGRPVIGNSRPELLEAYLGMSTPFCEAKTAEEVCIQLKRLVFDSEEREKLGMLGRQFVEEHCNPRRAAEICLQRFQAAVELNKSRPGMKGTSHAYYLQKCYQVQQALRSLQQVLYGTQRRLEVAEADLEANRQAVRIIQTDLEGTRQILQTTQTDLHATRDKLVRYKNSFPTQVMHKFRRLVKK
jgi:glycosyltransferase involved in cell wall biosynthesis